MTETTRTAEQLGREAWERRLKIGLSLSDISGNTKIRTQFLESIENGRLEELPQDLYARGFVKRYLEVIDSMDLWAEYQMIFPTLSPLKDNGSLAQYMPTQKGFQKVSKAWIFVFLLAAIGFSLYLIWQQRDVMSSLIGPVARVEEEPVLTASEVAPPTEIEAVDTADPVKVSEEEDVAATMETPPPEVHTDTSWIPGQETGTVSPEPHARTGRLVISANGPCWIGVSRDDGGRVQRTLTRGDTFETDIDVRTTVRFGSAGAVSLNLGGEEIKTIGKLGEVVTYEFLPDGSMKRL